MAKYIVTRTVTIDGKEYVRNDVVELTAEQAALYTTSVKLSTASNVRVGIFRVLEDNVVVAGEARAKGSRFETPDTDETKSLVTDGKLQRVGNAAGVLPRPSKEELVKIAEDAKKAKEAGEAAEPITNEERNFNTGVNLVGVNSPDPSVGDIVPVDIVMPNQVVDPRTGKVLDGAGTGLDTPQPLAPIQRQVPVKVEQSEDIKEAGRKLSEATPTVTNGSTVGVFQALEDGVSVAGSTHNNGERFNATDTDETRRLVSEGKLRRVSDA
jgi:hypothetical protein